MRWVCRACGSLVAAGAPCCPECRGTDYVEEETGVPVPKITTAAGITYEPGHEPPGWKPHVISTADNSLMEHHLGSLDTPEPDLAQANPAIGTVIDEDAFMSELAAAQADEGSEQTSEPTPGSPPPSPPAESSPEPSPGGTSSSSGTQPTRSSPISSSSPAESPAPSADSPWPWPPTSRTPPEPSSTAGSPETTSTTTPATGFDQSAQASDDE